MKAAEKLKKQVKSTIEQQEEALEMLKIQERFHTRLQLKGKPNHLGRIQEDIKKAEQNIKANEQFEEFLNEEY